MRDIKILLVCMPFADLSRPALGLSLLKAELRAAGVACDVAYLDIAFARLLGVEDYERVRASLPSTALAAEWVFSASFTAVDGDASEYVDGVLKKGWRPGRGDVEAVLRARDLAEGFIGRMLSEVPWGEYDAVGFSSFGAQNTASLALARRIKERHPSVFIVMGGHNWSGTMGVALHRQVPFVDVASLGYADDALPSLARALACDDEGAMRSVPGVSSRSRSGRPHVVPAVPVRDLDALPTPDHGDYFAAVAPIAASLPASPLVPLETSRGCWWAAKAPCMFCGMNGDERGYVSKSAERTVREVGELARAWPGRRLDVVDNVVPRRFLSQVLPQVTSVPAPPRLRFKIRPDAPLEALSVLARREAVVMCGLESLDDRLLARLNKGVTARQNLRLLRRCADLDIGVDWNLLFGIPGESARDYAGQVELVEGLTGVDPPAAVVPLALERSSPFWARPAAAGFGRPRPAAAYHHVYPFPAHTLREIAYFFDHDYSPPLSVRLHVARLQRAVAAWREVRGGQRAQTDASPQSDASRASAS